MPLIKVLDGHELADLVQEELQFEAADLNGIGITDALPVGVVVQLPAARPALLVNEQRPSRASRPVVKTVDGQTWIDLALQELGDEEGLFELCDLNGAGITDDVVAGTVIETPAHALDKQKVVNLLRVYRPASGGNQTPGGNLVEEGVEHWGIEFDFEVS